MQLFRASNDLVECLTERGRRMTESQKLNTVQSWRTPSYAQNDQLKAFFRVKASMVDVLAKVETRLASTNIVHLK